ncbi:MAG: acyl-CoA dehydrogenase [Bacteroidota bacterium]|nr:acyl-CoA dehydrogenase [Bacteroidota bacterium]MDE2958301.1 acyl-CoA dehydrogenase [Bacteroidota bacterium]
MQDWVLYGELAWWQVTLGAVAAVAVLGYTGTRFWLWSVLALILLYFGGAGLTVLAVVLAVALVFVSLPLRRALVTRPIMAIIGRMGLLPTISDTEEVAIKAGTVWVEGELFSGRPAWKRILTSAYPRLNAEEQAFLDGPVEELCAMVDEWHVWVNRRFPEEAWQLIEREKLFGMIIPRDYGGLGFSAMLNSAVVQKLQSRCSPMATTVMVPNSLGPAELLIHYGTQQQRDHYLPKLADATFIPAFALTEPQAGSDAGAIRAEGVLFQSSDGELMIRLNWQKRYITLAAVAHVLGLAFKLRDPDNLLGRGEHPGITCALIPSDAPGIVRNRRHDPLGVPFVNAPFEGHDVTVPLEAVIGGADGVGRGWRMLMESLAAGRGISLPASALGSAKRVFLVASAHAAVRRQFGLPIGKFGGIEEPLARIGGFTYLMDAARRYTLGGIDKGAAPAVVTAMVKYYLTELGRNIVMDGMDILGGNAISCGPRNLMASVYLSNPIAITVEGANILTRTLMIFGQGAIRCHPWAYREIVALQQRDLREFDRTFWGHIGHVVRNAIRSQLLAATRGYVSRLPVRGAARRYVRRINWASASFAFLADVAMGALGGSLKREEKITGRFADIFSWMYLGSATVRRFEAEGRRSEDLPYFRWSMEYALHQIQLGFEGLLLNLRVPGLTWFIRGPAFWLHRMNTFGRGPSDRTGHQVARLMQIPSRQRRRMTEGAYVPTDTTEALGRLEAALMFAHRAQGVEAKIRAAVRSRQLAGRPRSTRKDRAHAAGVITDTELALLREAEAACLDAIQVDAFDLESYARHYQKEKIPA